MAGRRRNNRRLWRALVHNLVQRGIPFQGGTTTVSDKEKHSTGSEFHDKRAYGYQHRGPAASAPPLTWEVPDDEKVPLAKACDKCHRCDHCGAIHEETFPDLVLLAPSVVARIKGLMRHFSDVNKNEREWLAYLVADERGVFVDLFVPKQVAYKAAVHVDRDALRGDEKIDGVIHSHNSMSAFHSGTDDDHLISNHPVSIVVAMKKDELSFHAVRNVLLSCGTRFIAKDVPVRMDMPDCEAWVEQAQSLVARGVYTSTVATGPQRWDAETRTWKPMDEPKAIAPGITEVTAPPAQATPPPPAERVYGWE